MSRYIDAEVALQSFCAECNHTIKCEDCDIKYHLEEFVPTGDVQEIKHGRWIKYPMDEWGAANCECSVCHTRQFFPLLLVKGGDNYCGNCGAKMDADDNYCTEENCEIFQQDLNCERCTK